MFRTVYSSAPTTEELLKRARSDKIIMETPAQADSALDPYLQIASPIHTILVLAALGGWTIWHKSFAQLNLTANPNRVRFYVVTILFEWLLFVLAVAGVRRSASVLIVLGDHWTS